MNQNKKIKIESHDNYQGRLNDVNDILDRFSNNIPDPTDKLFAKRWIGIKNVGKPYPEQQVKTAMDSLSTYLLNSNDFVDHKKDEEYAKLKRMLINGTPITKEEEKMFNQLNSLVICERIGKTKKDYDYVFIENKSFEKRMNDLSGRDKLNKIADIKNSALKIHSDISELKNNNRYIKKSVKDTYYKSGNKGHLADVIVDLSKRYSENKGNIKFLLQQMHDIIDDYKIITHQYF